MRKNGLAAVALAALAVSLSACAGNSSLSADTLYGGGTATATSNPMASSGSWVMASQRKTTVLTIKNTKIGYVLTNAQGDTLYWYSKDVKGSGTSACTGQCLQAWPAVTGKPAAAAGIKLTGVLGTITRPGGVIQVTYNGYPLYTYAGDSGPGATAGNGVGGVWHVITGKMLTSSVPSGSGGSSSSVSPYGSSSGGSGW